MQNSNISVKYKFLFYVEQNYSFDILRPLQIEALKKGHEVCWLLIGEDVNPLFLHQDEIQIKTIKLAVKYNPDAVFVPGNTVPNFIPGLKVEVFHGLNQSKRGNEYPERGLFDLYCTEGPERTFSLTKTSVKKDYFDVIETGWIKLDSLLNYESLEEYARPQILFSSTFSPSLSCAELAYEEVQRLSKDSKWQWLVTLHPKMSATTVKKYKALENDNLIFMDNNRVIECMHRADVMVCDNSSIFQEFLLLKKAVVTINNRSPLDCFINITEVNNLENAIESALCPSAELSLNIEKYGATVTPYLDGNSSKRVLAGVSNILQSGWCDLKPKNIIRNFKMRKKLNYWKI
ncbi:CDP-glycerol--glycerophosphate glycerophosphotransferase [Psychromonas sp. SP041]|uniref:CDP-glycerol--glycerophosphate glycerophosphotransferase n=1 Tax=Psychromonas sp. SP041 TaxID=1365007 RepID=UPI0003FB5420|nr:CDP-glycerol--glycerophosphate glycerophosphotransferase [Psychromonas sp. SP041]